MDKKQTSMKGFWIAFFISVMVLITLLSGYLLFFQYKENAKNVTINVTDVPKAKTQADMNLNVLFIGSNTQKDTAQTYMLMRFDAVEKVVYISALPNNTLSTVNTKTATLSEHYEYGGVSQVITAVENAYKVSVDRYVHFNKQNFVHLIDMIGGVEYYVPDNLKRGSVNLFAGVQLLDGRRLYEFLTYQNSGDSRREQTIDAVMLALINNTIGENFVQYLDTVYYTLINEVDTNVSFYDYSYRKNAIEQILLQKNKAKVVAVSGKTMQNGFEISEYCKEQF
ncbi:MAG: LCP family protein, partial [Oscillospiraceae bacterium]|nr:LCP family protein [Oscillospiraceae bacterium]